MEGFSLALGIWLVLPIPIDTEFKIGKDTYIVVGTVKRPFNKLFPIQGKVPYQNRDGARLADWVWQESFDDLGVDMLYIVDKNGTLMYFAGWYIQMLR